LTVLIEYVIVHIAQQLYAILINLGLHIVETVFCRYSLNQRKQCKGSRRFLVFQTQNLNQSKKLYWFAIKWFF